MFSKSKCEGNFVDEMNSWRREMKELLDKVRVVLRSSGGVAKKSQLDLVVIREFLRGKAESSDDIDRGREKSSVNDSPF